MVVAQAGHSRRPGVSIRMGEGGILRGSSRTLKLVAARGLAEGELVDMNFGPDKVEPSAEVSVKRKCVGVPAQFDSGLQGDGVGCTAWCMPSVVLACRWHTCRPTCVAQRRRAHSSRRGCLSWCSFSERECLQT